MWGGGGGRGGAGHKPRTPTHPIHRTEWALHQRTGYLVKGFRNLEIKWMQQFPALPTHKASEFPFRLLRCHQIYMIQLQASTTLLQTGIGKRDHISRRATALKWPAKKGSLWSVKQFCPPPLPPCPQKKAEDKSNTKHTTRGKVRIRFQAIDSTLKKIFKKSKSDITKWRSLHVLEIRAPNARNSWRMRLGISL